MRRNPRFAFIAALLCVLSLEGPALGGPLQEGVRPPVLFIAASEPPRPGIPIGPPVQLGVRPDIIRAVRHAEAVHGIEVDVTIDPHQADYILTLDVWNLPGPGFKTWTLIDARSGIVLEQREGLLLQNSVSDAVGLVARLWYTQTEPDAEETP